MKLPSQEYVADLYEKYAVPETIQRHCRKVRDVAMLMASGLQEAGVEIDLDLVDRLCLVHDAMKAATLPRLVENPDFGYVPTAREIELQTQLKEKYGNGLHETLIIADILSEEFPEFAQYVAKIGSTGNPTYLSEGIELKVAHYADWRVQLDQIVPFDQRLQYLKDTYLPRHPEKGDEWWQQSLTDEKGLEEEIFNSLSFSPNELAGVVQALLSDDSQE